MVGQDAWYGNVSYEEDRWRSQTFTLTGTEEVLANLDRYIGSVPDLVYGELESWAERIFQESYKEAPWDSTHLRQTGTVEPFEEGDWTGFQIGYAAITESGYNYGLRQHEDLTLHHPKPGTKAKFLEDPFNRIVPQVVPGIVSTIDEYFRAGVPSMSGMMKSKRVSLGNLGGRFI